MRVEQQVRRGAALTIMVDGLEIPAFEGETVAAAMIAARFVRFRTDLAGRDRGLFCNMGTCYECLVRIDDQRRPVRACLTEVGAGMTVSTSG